MLITLMAIYFVRSMALEVRAAGIAIRVNLINFLDSAQHTETAHQNPTH
jgi:hypothetical protein